MPLLSPHIANARYRRVLPHVRGDVLDIGCQRGQLLDLARDRITSYVGLDINAGTIAAARAAHPEAEFHLRDVDREPLGFEERFDTIVLIAVIEHLFNQGFLAEGLARALKPGGRVVLTTPTPFGNDVVHRLGASLGLFSRVAADGHIVIFNRKRLEILAGRAGLRLVAHRRFQLGCNQLAVLARPA